MITPQDQDQKLAILIDRMNRQEAVQPQTDDPLAVCLFAYRDQKGQYGFDAKLWEAIEEKTRHQTKVTPLYTLMRIAAAAIILAAVIFAVYKAATPEAPLLFATETANQEFSLPDGSVVLLRANSTLEQASPSSYTWNLTGEAWFDVVHDPDRIFEVVTNDGMVRVLGTSFNVSTWSGNTQVYLVEGSVELRGHAGTEGMIMRPGEMAAVHRGSDAVLPVQAEVPDITAWMQNHLVFTSREAGNILDEISHHFGILIQVPNGLSAQRLSGTLHLSGVSETLAGLGLVLNGSFKKTSEKTYVFEWHD